MKNFNQIKSISADQPFVSSNGLVGVSGNETTLAVIELTLRTDVEAVWLTGEIGWRILPFTFGSSRGRLEIKIKRDGKTIYKKFDDLFLIEGFSCGRRTTGVNFFDLNPAAGPAKYELIVSGTSENVDSFWVTGPLSFAAASLGN